MTLPTQGVGQGVDHGYDIFEDVPNPSSALEYGTQGVSLRARKPG